MTSQKETPAGGNRSGAQKTNQQNQDSSFSRSFQEINGRALYVLPLILARWLPGGRMEGREYVVRNPKRADNYPGSFKINVKTGRWSDFSCDAKGGDVISLGAYLFDVRQVEALDLVARMLGVTK